MKSKRIVSISIISITIVLVLISCTKEDFNFGQLIDPRDGETYKTIEIGNQTWMAENLNYDVGSGTWIYENNPSNTETYGLLYNGYTACNVCPEGWHLPSDEEWKELEIYLGMNLSEANSTGWRGTSAGSKLKSSSGWRTDVTGTDGNGTNESGFTALPGGYYEFADDFYAKGNAAVFWTSTETTNGKAWHRKLGLNFPGVYRYSDSQTNGFSVRCIRD